MLSVAPDLVSRHVMYGVLGGLIFAVITIVPSRWWHKGALIGYLIGNILLFLVLFISNQSRQTARWINLGDAFTIQPSQLALVTCGWYLVWVIERVGVKSWQSLLKILLLVGLPTSLIFLEPDLGSTVAFLGVMIGVIYLAGLSAKKILILCTIGVIFVGLSWELLLAPYQKARLTAFIAPQTGQSEIHYNAQQALIAIGSGQVWGRGPGQGSQSQYQFLPEKHTDFIFAAFSEEYGFVGDIGLIGLYALLLFILLRQAMIETSTGYRLWFGLLATGILLQSAINIGANLGLLPITGIPLPLFSSGGTALLGWFAALGLAYNRIWHSTTQPFHIK